MAYDKNGNIAKDIGDAVRAHVLKANVLSVQITKDTIDFVELIEKFNDPALKQAYNIIADDMERSFDVIENLVQDIDKINQYWIDYFTPDKN